MEDRAPLTLRHALVHRRWLVVAVVAAFLLAGAALSLRPASYQANAAIYLDTSRTAPGFDLGVATGELLQHDFIVMANSRAVLEQACQSPGVTCTPADLADLESTVGSRVGAVVYRGTSSLLVSAKAPTPDGAAALANAVAQAMIAQDRAEVLRLFKPGRDYLQKQLADLQAAIDKEQQALQHSASASSTAASHQAQLASLQNQYAATLTKQQDMVQQQERASNVATLTEPALPPLRPESPNPPRYLLLALLAGVTAAVLAALVAERLDDRIVTTDGLARAAGVPVALAAVPPSRRLPSPEHRPYALALASVLAQSSDTQALLVTAASARDHSDTVAAGLGAVAAHAGRRVVVVQSDGHSDNPGWFPKSDVAGMTTITVPSTNGEAIKALSDVRKQYEFQSADVVILMAVPSPDINPTALMLGPAAKRAVLAATSGVTRFQDARRTAELLRHSGVEVVAGILVKYGSRGKSR